MAEFLVIDEPLAAFTRKARVDRNRAITTEELSKPVLVIPLPTQVFGPQPGYFVIDGYHRITRALHEGVSELPAHFLAETDRESAAREKHGTPSRLTSPGSPRKGVPLRN
jgi:hypothetical protein